MSGKDLDLWSLPFSGGRRKEAGIECLGTECYAIEKNNAGAGRGEGQVEWAGLFSMAIRRVFIHRGALPAKIKFTVNPRCSC